MSGTDPEATGATAAPAGATPPGRHKPSLDDLAAVFRGSKGISSMAIVGIFLLGFLAFLHFAEAFVLPIVLAILCYFLLKPVVATLTRLHIPRAVGALLVLAVFMGALGFGLSALQEPSKKWLSKTPESLHKFESKGREFLRALERLTGFDDRAEEAPAASAEATGVALWKGFNLGDSVLNYSTLIYTASFLTGLLETVVLLYFLLATGDRFLRALVRMLPRQDEKDEAVAIVSEVQHKISRFLFTVMMVNACVGLLVALAMQILGMPNPILWGVVAGMLNFIPYFGPMLVFIVLGLAGLLTYESIGPALVPALVYLGLHAVESNLVTPAVLGRRLTLSPLIIFIGLMFWTWLWGMPGALLAVPLLMAFKILCDHVKALAPLGELLGG